MISKRHAVAIVLVAALGVLGMASAGLATATPDPPGQGPCNHGNSGKECKPDPQPDYGKDCEEHGRHEGGVNEDHCLGGTTGTTTAGTTTSSTTTSSTTTTVVTTAESTVTTVASTPSVSTEPSQQASETETMRPTVTPSVSTEPSQQASETATGQTTETMLAVPAGDVAGAETKTIGPTKAKAKQKSAAKVRANIHVLPFTP
jgi:hypothetical protein